MRVEDSDLYFDLVGKIYELEELREELNMMIVEFTIHNLFYNTKFFNSPEVTERLNNLVYTNNSIMRLLDIISKIAEETYCQKDGISLKKCYRQVLDIEKFFESYESYLNLLRDYKLCIEDNEVNKFTFKHFCYSYEDYLRTISYHFDLVLEEQKNRSIAKEEEMFMTRKNHQLLKLSKRYLQRLENSV